MKDKDSREDEGLKHSLSPESLISRRSQDLVIQGVESELVIHDTRNNTCHLLDEKAVALWELLEQPSRLSQIKGGFAKCFPTLGDLGGEYVEVTLTDFAAKGLVETEEALDPISEGRRKLLKAAGFVLVGSVFVPRPAAAASCTSCTAPALPQLLFTSVARSGNEDNVLLFTTTLCIAPTRPERVWIENPGGGNLVFDETVSFCVSSPGGVAVEGCATSFQATPCRGCTMVDCTPASANQLLPAVDMTRLFSPSGGTVPCGTYGISAWHCNAQGANTVSSIEINYGSAGSVPLGALVL